MQHEAVLKKVKQVTIIQSVLFLALGAFMVAFEAEFRSYIGYVLGVIAVICGIWRLIGYIRVRKTELIATGLFEGIVFLAAGAICFIRHGQVINYVTVILGVLLFAGALIKIQNAIDLHILEYFNWWIVLIFGFVSIVFAGLLILKPDFVVEVNTLMAAIFLIYDGLAGLVSVILMASVFKRIRKGKNPNKEQKVKPVESMEAQNTTVHEAAKPAAPVEKPVEAAFTAAPEDPFGAANRPKGDAVETEQIGRDADEEVPKTGMNFDPETGKPLH